MGMYPGPSCPDRPSSEELSMVEIDSQIYKVLDLGVNLNPKAGPVPYEDSVAFVILSFHCAHDST
jgi:hypothetical protein